MKVFVAGSYDDREKIAEIIMQLCKKRYEITLGWTSASLLTNSEEKTHCKKMCLSALQDADTVLFVVTAENRSYRGAYTELGMSIALEKKIYILDQSDGTSDFLGNFYTEGIPVITDINVVF